MILLPARLERQIRAAAEAAYPEEACGLLVGRRGAGDVAVDDAIASANVAADRARGFEVDPRVRFEAERRLRGTAEAVVGCWHSHPDHPGEPSERDRRAAFEPALVWIIVAVERGRAAGLRAFALDAASDGWSEFAVRILDETEAPR